MRKTKIVCTIGPATCTLAKIKALTKAGMNVARLNMSHGTYAFHSQAISNIKQVREEMNVPVSVMMDIKGPEIRIGTFENGEIHLKAGQEFRLVTRRIIGNEKMVSVSVPEFPKFVKHGQRILLNDGFVELKVKETKKGEVLCIASHASTLSNNKSINLPGVEVFTEFLSEVDKLDLLFGIKQNVDIFALSFVQSAKDVACVRKFLNDNGGENILLCSKIENKKGVDNLDEIIAISDGVMVARGDLGVEIDFKKIPYIQNQMIKKSNNQSKFVITATQMLESMIDSKRPTRAEISDIATAVNEGSDAIMLSGETACGKNPVLCVKTMSDIAIETEKHMEYYDNFKRMKTNFEDIGESICYSAVSSSFGIATKAIIAVTLRGKTARTISKFCPQKPIFACTPDKKTYHQLSVSKNVYPILTKYEKNSDKLMEETKKVLLNLKLVKKGDTVVETAGLPLGEVGKTNNCKIEII